MNELIFTEGQLVMVSDWPIDGDSFTGTVHRDCFDTEKSCPVRTLNSDLVAWIPVEKITRLK